MNKLFFFLIAPLALAQTPVIPLEGLDPVALVQGQQLDGDKKFSITRGEFQYLFANAANKAAFEKEPTRYEIQLGGSCARMGPRVGANADLYSVVDGKIYVFGSADCRKRFEAASSKYLESKQIASSPLSTTPAAVALARQVLARAVDAAGGAAKLDGLSSLQQTSAGERVEQVRTVVFPNRMRTHSVFNKQFVSDDIVDGAIGFGYSSARTREYSAPAVADMQREARRAPVAILRARNASDFRAAGVDDHTVDVEWAGERMLLRFDSSGRLSGLKYTGRGPEGEFGQIEYQFADFRKAGDLTLPFQITATFNDAPQPRLSTTISAIVLNPEIPPAFFEKSR